MGKRALTVVYCVFSFLTQFSHAGYYMNKNKAYKFQNANMVHDASNERYFDKKGSTKFGYDFDFLSNLKLGGEFTIDNFDLSKIVKMMDLSDLGVEMLGLAHFNIDDKLGVFGKAGLSRGTEKFQPKMVVGASYALTENLTLSTNVTHRVSNNYGANDSVLGRGDSTTGAFVFSMKW